MFRDLKAHRKIPHKNLGALHPGYRIQYTTGRFVLSMKEVPF